MKYSLFLILVLYLEIFGNIVVYAGCDNSFLKGAVPCDELGNYLSQSYLATDIREWGPYKGYFFVINNNTLRASISFNEEAIKIIQSRIDFALELDVVNKDKIIGDSWSYNYSSNFPNDVIFERDTSFMDPVKQLSLLILKPHLLEPEKEYIVNFKLEKPITKQGELKFNVSLSVDYPYPENIFYWKGGGWKYFTVEIDQFREFQYSPNWIKGICWVGHKNSGVEFCEEYFKTSVPLPSLDPEDYSKPPPPPANLPNLVFAKTGKSSPNLSTTVVIEKSNKDEDTNQKVHLGNLYWASRPKTRRRSRLVPLRTSAFYTTAKRRATIRRSF